jgi:hypothetical protein
MAPQFQTPERWRTLQKRVRRGTYGKLRDGYPSCVEVSNIRRRAVGVYGFGIGHPHHLVAFCCFSEDGRLRFLRSFVPTGRVSVALSLRVGSDLTLDKLILAEAAKGNF